MPTNTSMPRAPRTMARLVTGGVLAVLALAGCGAPPELRDASRVPPRTLTPTPTDASASPTPLPPTLPVAATSASSDAVATDCQGQPSGAAIVALIRRSDLLPDGVQVTVEKPPVCAGSWQYTVLQVPGHEPLQVVSKGKPGSLTLVTAGTDVCSIPVRTGAPPGIRTLAC